MQVHTLDKAGLISELNLGSGISHAVQQGRRADFSLILALFSNDVRDNTPVELVEQPITTEDILRKRLHLANPQPLRNDQTSYTVSAKQAEHFHQGGLASAKLSHYLQPEALAYLPEDTQGFPEDIYLNLSGHERRHLADKSTPETVPANLYTQLAISFRHDLLRAQA